MRLKRLEIKGFKSFAKETVIHFGEDVTGIVGPNGSGKSNIVDAIRWVLGEQKYSQLRLDKMSDIIFNGTKKRRPSNLAKVSITFENTKNVLPTEYNEVTISRLLYRNGDSEYRLNDVSCRLKDINSLLLDTGIGSDSYAIIALGMVDDILADKQNARRMMFEQAAGISKFKRRKHQTTNKLELTQTDLDRVEDLLHEINGNLKSLQKQARKAKRYRKYKNQYREASLNLARHKAGDLRVSYRKTEQKLSEIEDEAQAIKTKIHGKEADLEQLKKDQLEKEKDLTAAQQSFNKLVDRIRKLENDRKMKEQEVDFRQEKKEQSKQKLLEGRERIKQLNQQHSEIKQKLEQAEEHLETLKKERIEKQTEVDRLQKQYDQYASEADDKSRELQESEQEVHQMEKEEAVRQNRLDHLDNEKKRIAEQRTSCIEQQEELQHELRSAKVRLDNLEQEHERVEMEESKRREREEQIRDTLEKERQALHKKQRSLDAQRNEQQLLKSLIDQLEGFPESIKFLSKKTDWGKNVPLLSDIVYCPDEFRPAIEQFLDPWLSHYIVQDEEEAYRAIKLLSDQQKGKASFLLLNKLGTLNGSTSSAPTGAIPARSIVETDDRYSRVLDFLLQDVFIVEDAKDITSGSLNHQGTFLSKDGQIVRRKKRISGGSVGLFEGKKLGRKKQLEKLNKSIDRLESACNKIEQRIEHLENELRNLQEQDTPRERKSLEKTLRQATGHYSDLRNKSDHLQGELKTLDKRKEEIKEEEQELENRLNELETRLHQKRNTLDELRSQLDTRKTEKRAQGQRLSEAREKHSEVNIHVIRKENEVETIEKELEHNVNRRDQWKVDRDRLLKDKEQAERDITRLSKEIVDLKKEIDQAYDRREEKQSELSSTEERFFKERGAVREQEEELSQLRSELNKTQELKNQWKDRFNEIKMQLGNLGERMNVEFNVSLEDLLKEENEEEEDIEQEQLQEKVETLRNRIQNYGEVNPMAEEAFNEMKERHDNISQQRDDILEAKESLLQTIREIEETATQRFMDAFDEIQDYFKHVFRQLFTADDDCDLVLVEPEDPLHSEIEIIAKPKGKRPKGLSQLSGGEKTLTATALLFALYLYKPAPFCVFDEVDAPLDDANIDKFNRIIDEFSEDSQFIIVTHNKMTMAAVDVIYGVYMEEQGVSGVSPVDFRHLEHSTFFEKVGAQN